MSRSPSSNGMIAQAMKPHQETVMRLAEVPGFGVDSAQQVIAEVGVKASTLPRIEPIAWSLPLARYKNTARRVPQVVTNSAAR